MYISDGLWGKAGGWGVALNLAAPQAMTYSAWFPQTMWTNVDSTGMHKNLATKYFKNW